MPVPQNKKLVLKDFDLERLTLRENRTLFGSKYSIDEFYQFLLDHVDHETSWTVEEIGDLTRAELSDVRAQTMSALNDFLSVSESKPPSNAGQEATPTPSQVG